jgi:hypothetical protein
MKNRMKKIGWFVAAIMLITIAIYWFAKRPPQTAADSKPVKEMSAMELVEALNKDYKGTDSLYNEKNIAVEGKIIEIKETTVFLDAGELSTINCSFDSTTFETNKYAFKIGELVNIKGIYSGSEGFGVVADSDDMLADITGKNIILKTCAINKKQ